MPRQAAGNSTLHEAWDLGARDEKSAHEPKLVPKPPRLLRAFDGLRAFGALALQSLRRNHLGIIELSLFYCKAVGQEG